MSKIGFDGLIETHVIPREDLIKLHREMTAKTTFVPQFPERTLPLDTSTNRKLPPKFTADDEIFIKEHIIATSLARGVIPEFLSLEAGDIPHLEAKFGSKRLQKKLVDIRASLTGGYLLRVHKQTDLQDLIDQLDMTWNLSKGVTKAMTKSKRMESTMYHFLYIFQTLHPHMPMEKVAETMVDLLNKQCACPTLIPFVLPALDYSGPTWESLLNRSMQSTVNNDTLSKDIDDYQTIIRPKLSKGEKKKLAEALTTLSSCKYPQLEEEIISAVEVLFEATEGRLTIQQLVREMVMLLRSIDQVKSVVKFTVRLQMSLHFLVTMETHIVHQQEDALRRELHLKGREVMRMVKFPPNNGTITLTK